LAAPRIAALSWAATATGTRGATVETDGGRVVLALDQGTTSSRAIVFADDGRILGLAQREIALTYPESGWVEQDPLEIWEAQRATAAEALRGSGAAVSRVAAVGIANQRETTILWDRRTSLPIAPAIVWQDRRTAARCEELRRSGCEDLVRRRTGLLLDPYFSATKIAWLLDNVPGARERAERGELAFGTVDSWLAWQLTGGRLHVTDATNASRTLLYDLHGGVWDDELLELFRVPRALLPEIRDTSGVVGETDAGVLGEDGAGRTSGAGAAFPLASLVGDQQSALFGQACVRPAMAKVTYGTGCFLLLNTGESPVESKQGLVCTVALQRGGRRTYALEGSVFIGGAAVQWLRDGLGIIGSAAEVGALAGGVASSEGVYFVPALAGLGAPHWDPHARGAILGVTRGTTAAHIARATLEGIAFQVSDLLAAVVAAAGLTPDHLRAAGGATANDLLMQIQADVIALPVTRAAQKESTALGAALLAGLATGVWRDEAEALGLWHAERTFEPDAGVDRGGMLAGWRAAVACVRQFGRDAGS
jgi:glycerol kinase